VVDVYGLVLPGLNVMSASARGLLMDELAYETTWSRTAPSPLGLDNQTWLSHVSNQDIWAAWPAEQYVADDVDLGRGRSADRQKDDDLDACDRALMELLEDLETVVNKIE
jgi:hypothetical protein